MPFDTAHPSLAKYRAVRPSSVDVSRSLRLMPENNYSDAVRFCPLHLDYFRLVDGIMVFPVPLDSPPTKPHALTHVIQVG